MSKRKAPVAVRFSTAEHEKLRLAEKYTMSNNTCGLIRSCTILGMKNVLKDGQIVMTFSPEHKVEKDVAYTTQLHIDNDNLHSILECVPMTPSNIIKCIVMPEVDKIIENRGWSK